MKIHAINAPSKGNHNVHTGAHVLGSSDTMAVHFQDRFILMLR